MCAGSGSFFGNSCYMCGGKGKAECGCVAFQRAYKEDQERRKNMTPQEEREYDQQQWEQIRRNQMILDQMNSSGYGNSSSSSNSFSCPNCRGTGQCSYCGGSGWSPSVSGQRCSRCNGSGKCSGAGSCHGTGRIR